MDLPVDFEVDGEISARDQRPANAEAMEQATEVLRDLTEQGSFCNNNFASAPCDEDWDEDAAANDCASAPFDEDWDEDAAANDWGATHTAKTADDDCVPPTQEGSTATANDAADSTPKDESHKSDSKPLVDAPEFGDRVRDTDKEAHWIPGAFPNIFQNQTGDLHNYKLKEPDMLSWGPHIMRSRGWHAQGHMTFPYWWLNMVQRSQALSAKKWYVRDNPKATGYTMDDLRKMNVRQLAKNMVGYTAGIPGTRASKSQLRRVILTMVKQIEIETSSETEPGDVPSLFGTLTTQRYLWDDIIRIIAEVEEREDYTKLSKSKRRELVNKYPLFVAWYCSVRLELILKTVVVPVYGASAYVAVYEWSPTGGMVHLHYILWKRGAPRFDLQAQELLDKAAALKKAGLVAGAVVECNIRNVVDFFEEFISEYNPNKNPKGQEKASRVAETVNEAEKHTASLSTTEMLDLLRNENPHDRYAYYTRAVRTEHLHDFHYPNPLGPPNPAQPCAQLLKGTINMWYCGNGYPRELVQEPGDRSVAQDAIRPDLWRVNLCRNCQMTNPHIPLVTLAMQSNVDATPVATRHQAEMYCCKYCSKYTKGKGHKCALYEIIDDMERRDDLAQERFGGEFVASKLNPKLHKVFMEEIGVEMCQAEVAHHANKGPESLVSRNVKYVHLYKKALELKVRKRAQEDEIEEWGDDGAEEKPGTKPSDIEVYERRQWFSFWPPGTPISPHLPPKNTPEEQVSACSLWNFFRLVKFRNGRHPYFQWHDAESPIVVMSPVVKLTEGPNFAFGARWALMQYRSWSDRREIMDMNDDLVKETFRSWRLTDDCPWYVKQQYLEENGRRVRSGAGYAGTRSRGCPDSAAMEPADYQAKLDMLVAKRDFAGAAALQLQQKLCSEKDKEADKDTGSDEATGGEWDSQKGSDTEISSKAEELEDAATKTDTHVLKMLYKGNMEEVCRQEQQLKKARVFNRKHNCYRNTRCTSLAQEEQSALPAGVINVNEDSDDDEEYQGEQKEIQKEMDELRVVKHWINQPGWDVASEVCVMSRKAKKPVHLRLDWGDVQSKLSEGSSDAPETKTNKDDEATQLANYALEKLDPTQRAFADRVLKWARSVVDTYSLVSDDGRPRPIPLLRCFLGGSAGSGKSTTLKTCVVHIRHLFKQEGVPAKIELTAYTGVAAFNIGFGARTACSAFQVFPNAAWKKELEGTALRKLEDTWHNVVLLIIDEISFIGTSLFARMHFRTQQAKRDYFSERGLDPNLRTFGDLSLILVGDFGQLDPINDWSLCDTEASWTTCPKKMAHLWKHHKFGKLLLREFKEAVMLKHIHRSREDMWWTESCLRLRDFTCTKDGDYEIWRKHDLNRGHLSEEQLEYFENKALWLCARCEDVGQRNGRKLAQMALDKQELVHQIQAQHSSKCAKKYGSSAFDGLRAVVHLVRGCKTVLTRNVAYKYGLANGTRGVFIGAVYGPGGVGTFPEAIVCDFPDYCGPVFYPDEPTWVPILPMTAFKNGTRMTRTQFPLVPGFALTVNKAQGLTVKEGVVIHLVGSRSFRPAAKHGLPFVAFTRSESFAMTAFKNLPPWEDFVKGRESDMLKMRLAFTAQLDKMHTETLACHSPMKTAADEMRAYETWQEASFGKRQKQDGPAMPCPCCKREFES